MRYTMLGFFWCSKRVEPYLHKFEGEINVNNNGDFEGWTKDEFGIANVKGRLPGASLIFEKRYCSRDGLFIYDLEAQLYNDAKRFICGGWKGDYKALSGGEEDCGKVACMIFPS